MDCFRLMEPSLAPVDENTSGKKYTFRVQCSRTNPILQRKWFWLCAGNKRTMAKWMMALYDSPKWYQNTELDREEFKKRFAATGPGDDQKRTTIPVQSSEPVVAGPQPSDELRDRRHTLAGSQSTTSLDTNLKHPRKRDPIHRSRSQPQSELEEELDAAGASPSDDLPADLSPRGGQAARKRSWTSRGRRKTADSPSQVSSRRGR